MGLSPKMKSCIRLGKKVWRDFSGPNNILCIFYNGDDVNMIMADLWLTKPRSTSFYKKRNLSQETRPADVNKVWKLNIKGMLRPIFSTDIIVLNFFWLVYSKMFGKFFSIYGVQIPRKLIESSLLMPLSPQNSRQNFLKKFFSPRRNGWRKLWFALSKFNQKIWRWLGTLVNLHFIWFVIFLNVMALQSCK